MPRATSYEVEVVLPLLYGLPEFRAEHARLSDLLGLAGGSAGSERAGDKIQRESGTRAGL